MDFNIQDHIQKIKERVLSSDPQNKEVFDVLSKYSSHVTLDSFVVKGSLLNLNQVHPIHKIKIKMKKNRIIKDLRLRDIYIRDIL